MVEVFGGINDGGRTDYAAVVVDEEVAHDGENPAFEVGVFFILVFVVEGFESGVLHEVVGVVAVGGEHECETEHVTLERHELVLKFLVSHFE